MAGGTRSKHLNSGGKTKELKLKHQEWQDIREVFLKHQITKWKNVFEMNFDFFGFVHVLSTNMEDAASHQRAIKMLWLHV